MKPLRIHATNLTGMGSRRLAQALLPDLLKQSACETTLYIPRGDEFGELARHSGAVVAEIRRRLPNALSRFLEVTVGTNRYRGDGDLLVLGDLPLAGIADQTVLVAQAFLIQENVDADAIARAKFALLRRTFALTQGAARRFIVQTPSMREGLTKTYGIEPERIAIIGQPPPEEILHLRRSRAAATSGLKARPLSLFYPSRCYPHKRHDMLCAELLDRIRGSVGKIVLTVNPSDMTHYEHPLLDCIGEVSMARVASEYLYADALLFLSSGESYGLPLLEALWLDLPVICPDLPYARDILGENQFFFRFGDPASLAEAIERLQVELSRGWRADWAQRRKLFPQNWQEVAKRFMDVVRS